MSLGVTDVFRETFGSALSASEKILQGLGSISGTSQRAGKIFAEHDKKLVIASAAHQNDLATLINLSNKGKAELESLMRGDRENVS